MIVRPIYLLHQTLRDKYARPSDTICAIQVVDPYFQRKFNDEVFLRIAAGKEVRATFVEGHEIGDSVNRYYLQIC